MSYSSHTDYRRNAPRRNRRHACVGGVCAGLADYFGTDRTLVRIAAIVSAILLTKVTLIAYGVAWLILDD